jgi:hypothetical protein
MKIELEEKMKIYESKESEFKNVLSEKGKFFLLN